MKNKKATINPINCYDKKCFQHAVAFTLKHKELKKNSERIPKTKPFISEFNMTAYILQQKGMSEKNSKIIIRRLIVMCIY